MRFPYRSACLAALSLASTMVLAQPAYPDKTIRFVVPFTAGSGTDIVARTVGEAMSRGLGQTIIIENRPGAGGTLGAAMVAKSAPDGYTLLVHSAGHVANPSMYANLPYDTIRDFAGVTPLASLPNVLIVSPAKGWKTVQELVDKARANPGALNYGSAGVGSATHMNAEIFRLAAKYEAVHVPYKGTPEAVTETATGRIDFFFAPPSSPLPPIQYVRLQARAAGGAQTLEVIVFPGGFNWPLWVGEEKGFFAAEGIEMKLTPTPNSVFQMQNLAAGKFDIAFSTIDNVVAYDEGQGEAPLAEPPDFFAFMGGQFGAVRLVTQPDIKSIAELKGKSLAVDAATTGYAFVLRKILQQGGLAESDYELERLGGTAARAEALMQGKTAGTILTSPLEIVPEARGYRRLANAGGGIGPHQAGLGGARPGLAESNQNAPLAFLPR